MTQRELDRAVSQATGEAVGETSHRGFSELKPLPAEREPEEMIVDWDALQLGRNVALVEQRQVQQPALA